MYLLSYKADILKQPYACAVFFFSVFFRVPLSLRVSLSPPLRRKHSLQFARVQPAASIYPKMRASTLSPRPPSACRARTKSRHTRSSVNTNKTLFFSVLHSKCTSNKSSRKTTLTRYWHPSRRRGMQSSPSLPLDTPPLAMSPRGPPPPPPPPPKSRANLFLLHSKHSPAFTRRPREI